MIKISEVSESITVVGLYFEPKTMQDFNAIQVLQKSLHEYQKSTEVLIFQWFKIIMRRHTIFSFFPLIKLISK